MEMIEVRDRRGGFLWVSNQVFDHFAKRLNSTAFMLYLALCRMANNETQECFPSQPYLAKMIGVDERTVRRVIEELISLKLVGVEKIGRAYRYTLLKTPDILSGIDLVDTGHPCPPKPDNLDENTGHQCPANKTNNKTKEQYLSSPSVQSGNDLVLRADEQVSHSSKEKKEPDPRTASVRKMLADFWNSLNAPDELYWEAGDGAQLKAFLKRWPKRSVRDIAQALEHYSQSEGIVETRAPKEFLPRLHLYFEGPLNQFSHPLEAKRASS